jgi:hypothetical protein
MGSGIMCSCRGILMKKNSKNEKEPEATTTTTTTIKY